MPLPIRSLQNFISNCVGKIQQTLTGIDPNQNASLLKALVQSQAAAGYSLQDAQQDIINNMFWQTAQDGFLAQIGAYDGTVQYPAVGATGQAAVNGTLNTLIPALTPITYLTVTYLTQQDATVQNNSGSASMGYAGGIVTATCTIPHNLATGISVTITGCNQSALNGTYTVTVTGLNTFTYSITPGSYTSDSGTYNSIQALLTLSAQNWSNTQSLGNITNALAGTALKLSVTNVNTTAYVTFNGLSNGSDPESLTAFRARVGLGHSNTPGIACPWQFIWSAKKIPGITRVFPIRAQTVANGGGTGTPGTVGYIPNPNETVIYSVMDNALNILPGSSTLTQIINQFQADGLWPTDKPITQLYVIAPQLYQVNFTFTSITPFTTTMQNAVITQLTQFFIENAFITWPITPITMQQIYAFLNNIQDPATGQYLTAYTLTSPNATITPGSGQLAVLGTCVF